MSSLRPTRWLILILVLTFGAFSPSLANGFALDDVPVVQSVREDGKSPDPVINGLHPPWWYFGQRYWAGTDNLTSRLYRPMTILTFALTFNLISAPLLPDDWEAFPHHLLNVLLHCFAVWLVWWMLRDLTCGEGASLVGAASFGFHALHSEVVAGVVGRAELLAFAFGLAATLVFVRGRVWSAGLLYLLAFCSKESALAWAPFLPCYLLGRYWMRDRSASVGSVLVPRITSMAFVVGVPLVVFFVLREVVIGDLVSVFSYQQNPLVFVEDGTRVMTAVKLLGYALYLCCAPFELFCIYGPGVFGLADTPSDVGWLAAGAILSAWLVGSTWFARRLPLLFLSAAMFLGFSFITSNVPFAIGTIFGERLYYMPSLGVCLLPVVVMKWAGPRGRNVLLAVLAVWCIANIVVVQQRNLAFRSSVSLFLVDAERCPESADLQAKAGYMYWTEYEALGLSEVEGEAKALEFLRKALERDENMSAPWSSIARIHDNRGRRELLAGREAEGRNLMREAVQFYQRSLRTRYIAESGVENRTIEDYLAALIDLGAMNEVETVARDVIARKPKHHFGRLVLLDHCRDRFTASERITLIKDGLIHWPDDPYLILQRAMIAYESGAINENGYRRIAGEINGMLRRVEFRLLSTRTKRFSRIYLGEALGEIGERAQALQVLRSLLDDQTLPTDLRTRVRSKVTQLEKRNAP